MLKRNPRGRPTEQITTTTLRELLQSKVLNKRLVMPSDAELEKLAETLERWRVFFQGEQNLLISFNSHETTLIALETLSSAIDNLQKLHVSFLSVATSDSAPPTVIETLAIRLAAIGEAHRLTERIAELLSSAPSGFGALGWVWIASVLPIDFARAMQPANPKFHPGLGHTGPLARFIAAVTPALTGEHPSPGSVATQLKALRRRQRENEHHAFSLMQKTS